MRRSMIANAHPLIRFRIDEALLRVLARRDCDFCRLFQY